MGTVLKVYDFSAIKDLIEFEAPRMIVISPATFQLCMTALSASDKPSAFGDSKTMTTDDFILAHDWIDQAIYELMGSSEKFALSFKAIRDALGGQDIGADQLSLVRSIRQALGAPGPDADLAGEWAMIAEALG